MQRVNIAKEHITNTIFNWTIKQQIMLTVNQKIILTVQIEIEIEEKSNFVSHLCNRV